MNSCMGVVRGTGAHQQTRRAADVPDRELAQVLFEDGTCSILDMYRVGSAPDHGVVVPLASEIQGACRGPVAICG